MGQRVLLNQVQTASNVWHPGILTPADDGDAIRAAGGVVFDIGDDKTTPIYRAAMDVEQMRQRGNSTAGELAVRMLAGVFEWWD